MRDAMKHFWRLPTTPEEYDKGVRKMSGVLDETPIIDYIKNFKKSVTVVSLGIGTGRELEWLDKIKNVTKIIGIDYSAPMLRFCRKRAKQCKKKVILLKDNIAEPVKLKRKVSKIKKPIIYLALINTLGNFSFKERELALQKTRNLMKRKDGLIICLYKLISQATISTLNIPPYLHLKTKEARTKLTEIIEYALQPFVWRGLIKKYNQLPRFWYDEKENDITAYIGEKKTFISHRFSKEEIKTLHKKAGLKIEKLIEGKAMYTVVSKKR